MCKFKYGDRVKRKELDQYLLPTHTHSGVIVQVYGYNASL